MGVALMPIPNSQLDTWSNPGAPEMSRRTYQTIRNALLAYEWPSAMDWDAYLQGSYANSTNIYGNSDVDVVVETGAIFYSNLNQAEKQALDIIKGSFAWSDFCREVIGALEEFFGASDLDTSGEKSLKLSEGSNRLAADIVPAVEYRRYDGTVLKTKGIAFWPQSGGSMIVNYPKLHIEYGRTKNRASNTGGWFKPTVRMFKNVREKLVRDDSSLKGRYPSYFLECLIYNIPNSRFGGGHQGCFHDCLAWLTDVLLGDEEQDFVCQNRQQWLFGGSVTQWNEADAQRYVGDVIELWNNW